MLNKHALPFAALLLWAAITPTAHASREWKTVVDLCWDADDNPLTCWSEGQLLANANFDGPHWNASLNTDMKALCTPKVREAQNDPNWPEDRIGGGCSVVDSYWYPEPAPCPSDRFCPRTREDFLQCCTDHRSVGGNLDPWMAFQVENGANVAFESLACGCFALIDIPD